MKITTFIAAITLFLEVAPCFADTLATFHVQDGQSGYPCNQTIIGSSGREYTLHLSQDSNGWSLDFIVNHVADKVSEFFDQSGLQDSTSLANRFQTLTLNGQNVQFGSVMLDAVQKSELGDKTALKFSVETKYYITKALDAMQYGKVDVSRLFSLDGAQQPIGLFRSCAQKAMGSNTDNTANFNARSAFKVFFDNNLSNWISAGVQANTCGVASFGDEDINKTIDRAAEAFYPGILNILKRRSFKKGLQTEIAIAKMDGAEKAMNNCLAAETLFTGYSDVIDKAITSASGDN